MARSKNTSGANRKKLIAFTLDDLAGQFKWDKLRGFEIVGGVGVEYSGRLLTSKYTAFIQKKS